MVGGACKLLYNSGTPPTGPQDSHSVIGQVSNLPNPIQLVVVRQAGVFGEVHVAWNVSNNNNMSIAPSSGEVGGDVMVPEVIHGYTNSLHRRCFSMAPPWPPSPSTSNLTPPLS